MTFLDTGILVGAILEAHPEHVACLSALEDSERPFTNGHALAETFATLTGFYRRVRPAGPGWRPIRAVTGLGPSPDSLAHALLGWMLGCLFVYSALFGMGSLLYAKWPQAALWAICFVVSGVWLARLLRQLWSVPVDRQAA